MALAKRQGRKRPAAAVSEIEPPAPPKSRRSVKPETETNGVVAVATQGVTPGAVLVFGEGVSGQLGLTMDVTEKPLPCAVPNVVDIIDVAAGGMHTVCLTSDHKLITFGCNDEGALGRETNDEEGTEGIPGNVEIPGKIVQISAGDSHTAALLENGSVYVFGTFRDNRGPLGLLNTTMEKKPVLLNAHVKFTRIASGAHHLALLGVDGNIYTAGCGEQGQLGRVSERTSTRDSRHGPVNLLTPMLIRSKAKFVGKFTNVWTGSYNTLAKDKMGNIHVWGLNNYKQLGMEENLIFHPVVALSFSGHDWKKIAGGEHHTLALDNAGDVYALGRKEYGRLGLGDNCEDAPIPKKVDFGPNKKIVDISCGSFTSFALADDGILYSWGMGSSMLGVGGEETDLWTPTQVKGKQLQGKKIVRVESGGQHTVILVNPTA
ncbi:Regulator of chromosome condensation (RCC1) repeat [Nesidiocoris tenuis]|uniref:Regulator of chromosome condensation (RCC1) repeat n=1 Tax=Nesidiocoris tenuis TaxID=355587 RepID=A0ABN7BCY1_9HEMI|nr:Regulator of chromosome condensation (RCC1) repeat [Nesidiocoris tenuis]